MCVPSAQQATPGPTPRGGGEGPVRGPGGLPSDPDQELEWLRGAVDTMTSGMVVVQADGTIVFSNAAAQRMYASGVTLEVAGGAGVRAVEHQRTEREGGGR